MKSSAIILVRSSSSRLPGKAKLPLFGMPMIELLVRRIQQSQQIQDLIIATSTNPEDDWIEELFHQEDLKLYRGSLDNVLDRFAKACQLTSSDYVVRITGDCPFVDGRLLDYCLAQCKTLGSFDLATTKNSFPCGVDFEICRKKSLLEIHRYAQLSEEDKEHVTKHFYDHPQEYRIRQLVPPAHLPKTDRKFVVDTPTDYDFAKTLAQGFSDTHFSIEQLIQRANLL